ncbi:hypothetical protein FQR65_LT06407 [Abscondita terminalis]|nr:hypothetical protein FQR65_LT06407 [Abscondita terminalis]
MYTMRASQMFFTILVLFYVCEVYSTPILQHERTVRSAQLPEGVQNIPKTIVEMGTSLAQDYGKIAQSVGDAIKNAMPVGP